MYEPVQQCGHCGAGLTLEHLRGVNCPYCNTVFPHHSQAAQHAVVVNQVMGQMMAQQQQVQDQWRGAFGMGQPPTGMPSGPPPYGGAVPTAPGQPYGHPNQIVDAHLLHAANLSRRISNIVVAVLAGVFVMAIAIVALVFFLVR